MSLHHLMQEPTFRESIKCIALAEAEKHVEDVRRFVRDGNAQQAALSEARATVFEALLATLREYAAKYKPA